MSYSVIMPVYNGRDFFEVALLSAIEAIGAEDEIIVVEDGSNDGGVAELIARHNGKASIGYHRKENGGVASALNLGLELAEKINFAWLSHDDIYLPNRFVTDKLLRKHSPDAITCSNFYLLNNDNLQLKFIDSIHSLSKKQRFRLLSRRFLNGNCLTAPVALLKKYNGFDVGLRHTQDYDLWLRMIESTDIVAIPDGTVLSRQHPRQDSKAQPKEAREEYYSLLKKNVSWKDLVDPRNALDLFRILDSLCRR